MLVKFRHNHCTPILLDFHSKYTVTNAVFHSCSTAGLSDKLRWRTTKLRENKFIVNVEVTRLCPTFETIQSVPQNCQPNRPFQSGSSKPDLCSILCSVRLQWTFHMFTAKSGREISSVIKPASLFFIKQVLFSFPVNIFLSPSIISNDCLTFISCFTLVVAGPAPTRVTFLTSIPTW